MYELRQYRPEKLGDLFGAYIFRWCINGVSKKITVYNYLKKII